MNEGLVYTGCSDITICPVCHVRAQEWVETSLKEHLRHSDTNMLHN